MKHVIQPLAVSPLPAPQRKKDLAVWLREGLVKLGPTFIKIGQQFSTRVDVLAPEFVKELEKLQDNVPAFEWDTAKVILQKNLGKPVEEVFEEFDTEPIAAASLGQVRGPAPGVVGPAFGYSPPCSCGPHQL